MSPKIIFVTGGVVSSVGKGVAASSIAKLLRQRGYKVCLQKLDPYLNVDPGTMSPYQHGEVFVLDDGAETDLDLGHYERLGGISLNRYSSVSTGQIYEEVLSKERRGDFLGRTIQIIPHITNEIKRRIRMAIETTGADIGIVEIGGTVGDIESEPYLEAIRQLRFELGQENTFYCHLTWLPFIGATRELKTKPTQHSVRMLRSVGISPDALIARADYSISKELLDKISQFCDVERRAVIGLETTQYIYEVPLIIEKSGLADYIVEKMKLPGFIKPDLSNWERLVSLLKQDKPKAPVALVGKYVELHDSYISVAEALCHAGLANGIEVDIHWISAVDLENGKCLDELEECAGIIIPGGFGNRGVDGKMLAIEYARENKVPLLGLCLGMQLICVEYARNVLGLTEANSTEFNPNTPYPVIDLMEEQKMVMNLGGTMRLGSFDCKLVSGSKAYCAYGREIVRERHRHRFELNNEYRPLLEENGLKVTGASPNGVLAEIVEVENHPFLVGTQFHPEFKSKLDEPHPIFVAFVKSVIGA